MAFVRLGEWKVVDVDTTKFSGAPLCNYWDDNTKAQCEADMSCKTLQACTKTAVPNTDCQRSDGGTICSEPYQVHNNMKIMITITKTYY